MKQAMIRERSGMTIRRGATVSAGTATAAGASLAICQSRASRAARRSGKDDQRAEHHQLEVDVTEFGRTGGLDDRQNNPGIATR